jgi:uncharacterized protein
VQVTASKQPTPASKTRQDLRRQVLTRTLAAQPDLATGVAALGFVQADPMRAPARAQDLTLMQRVAGYRAGDLERLYPQLALEEDVLHNYGFITHEYLPLLHPRLHPTPLRIEREQPDLVAQVLNLVESLGQAHPKQIEAALGRIRVINGWGGQSNATTRVLEALHYRGQLRVVRREKGIRVYQRAQHSPQAQPEAERARALIVLLLRNYAPLPAKSLSQLIGLLGYGVPDLAAALLRATLKQMQQDGTVLLATVEGEPYLWPACDHWSSEIHEGVRFFGPFDPVVWDRRRFEQLWGWAYRLEAYTKPAKRQFGHYALPLLWREQMVGWVNLTVSGGVLEAERGYIEKPREKAFQAAFEAEMARFEAFLGLSLPA